MITWRVPVVAAVLVVLVGTGFFVVARPYLPKHSKDGIRLPDHRPSNASWLWPDGVPGWRPGATYKGFDVSGVQPIEVQAAQLAAARKGLDAGDVRVLQALHPDRRGLLAVLAAPTLGETPVRTCLAAVFRDAPIVWECPRVHHLSHKHVYVAAVVVSWPLRAGETKRQQALYLAGVARGDVTRVVFGDQTLYTRGKTWGEFGAAWVDPAGPGPLVVYGHEGVLESITPGLKPDQLRILR